jgi:hypothetical protein
VVCPSWIDGGWHCRLLKGHTSFARVTQNSAFVIRTRRRLSLRMGGGIVGFGPSVVSRVVRVHDGGG